MIDAPPPSDFFSPTSLLHRVWSNRKIVAGAVFFGIAAGLLDAVLTTASFQATMIVGPPDMLQSDGAASGGVLSQLGQAAGLQVNTPGDQQIQMYRLLMTGVRVARKLEDRYHLLRQLDPDDWNEKEHRWKERSEVHLGAIGTIKQWLGLLHWSEPTYADLATLVSQRIQFIQIPKTSYYIISSNDKTPEGAALLLTRLSAMTDEVYSEGLAEETQARIAYTNSLLVTETRTNVREAQMRLLDQYSNRLIGLHSGQSLLVQIVQPPTPNQTPIWPRPSLMIILGAVTGLLAGLVLAVFWPASAVLALRKWFRWPTA